MNTGQNKISLNSDYISEKNFICVKFQGIFPVSYIYVKDANKEESSRYKMNYFISLSSLVMTCNLVV